MSNSWANISDSNVFTSWKPAGVITGLLEKSGVLDNSPLYNYLTDLLKSFGEVKRKF